MPVTVILEQHQPREHPQIDHSRSLDAFLRRSCPEECSRGRMWIRASSFYRESDTQEHLYPSPSSLVRSVVEAWGRHSHLVLRPDDFWFQILAQLNLFMAVNGESLRHLFVPSESQEDIEVLEDDDWNAILRRFEQLLQERAIAPWLADWARPAFSTSRPEDDVTATVLLIGVMKTFNQYSARIMCGNPSITLLGTKQDWKSLAAKVDRLEDFGNEPQEYKARLRPILSRILETFDNPSSPRIKLFWDQIVKARIKYDTGASTPPLQYTVSGWILGFFYWNSTGQPSKRLSEGVSLDTKPGALVLDNVQYGEESLDNLPVGYGTVSIKYPKVKGQSDGGAWHGWLIAGSIGKSIIEGAPEGYLQNMTQPGTSVESPSAVSPEAQNPSDKAKKTPNRLSGIFSKLKHFPSNSPATADDRPYPMSRQTSQMAAVAGTQPVQGHSTIQPRSGWALFGSQYNFGPLKEKHTEIEGPTVAAIESCKNVERYGQGPLVKGLKSAVARGEADLQWYHHPPMEFEATWKRSRKPSP